MEEGDIDADAKTLTKIIKESTQQLTVKPQKCVKEKQMW